MLKAILYDTDSQTSDIKDFEEIVFLNEYYTITKYHCKVHNEAAFRLNGLNVYFYFESQKEYENKVVNYLQLLSCAWPYIPNYIFNLLVKYQLKNIKENGGFKKCLKDTTTL